MVHQSNYIDGLRPMDVCNADGRKRNDKLSEEETKDFRALVGQLNWLCTQTLPDLSYDVCELSSAFCDATVDLIN